MAKKKGMGQGTLKITLATIFAVALAWILNWLFGVLSGINPVFGSIAIPLVGVGFLTWALAINPGKETFLGVLITGAWIGVVVAVFSAFGLTLLQVAFDSSTWSGLVVAVGVITFATMLSARTLKALK